MDIVVLDIFTLDNADIGHKLLGHKKLDILVVFLYEGLCFSLYNEFGSHTFVAMVMIVGSRWRKECADEWSRWKAGNVTP